MKVKSCRAAARAVARRAGVRRRAAIRPLGGRPATLRRRGDTLTPAPLTVTPTSLRWAAESCTIGKMYKADRALYIEGRCSSGGMMTQASDHAGHEGRASRRHLERRAYRDAAMPIKKRGGHRRGAAGKPARAARPASGSVPGAGKHRDAAPTARGRAARKFGSRKPKGSFGARDTKSHGFEPRDARKAACRAGEAAQSFGDRKPKGPSAGRDEKPRSRSDRAGAPMRRSRREMAEEQLRRPQAARANASSPASARRRRSSAMRRSPSRRRCPRSRPACRPSRWRPTKPACGSIASSRRDFPGCRSAISSASCAKARCG